MHWPDLDEDISAENQIYGQPSDESQNRFKSGRKTGPVREPGLS